jgi:tetratricopeptide (TPR) repeat protein
MYGWSVNGVPPVRSTHAARSSGGGQGGPCCGLVAVYYTEIRLPRESWRSLDDMRPQLAEFELRCDTGDYDTAATVLADIDFDHLQVWGHYRTLVQLHARIHGRITDPLTNSVHLGNLGLCYASLDDYRQAIDLHTQALAIARQIGDRRGEGGALGNLGICHASLGDYPQAIDLHTQAPGCWPRSAPRRTDHEHHQQSQQLVAAWTHQRLWPLTANRLKQRLDRPRLAALLLAVATAVLAVAADQIGGLGSAAGRALSAAAITAGLATFCQRRASTEQINETGFDGDGVFAGVDELGGFLAGGVEIGVSEVL